MYRKNQLDAQLIFSIFRHPVQVSGVSRPIIRRYNRTHTYTTIGTYYSFQVLKIRVKGEAIPLQAWTGPEGSRRLRLPDFKTIGKRGQ